MTKYIFKGHDWFELVEYFGLEQKETLIPIHDPHGEVDMELSFYTKEKISMIRVINGMKITFELKEKEEVELEKLKQYLHSRLSAIREGEIDDTREVLMAYLDKLIESSENRDYNSPVFKGIKSIEDDEVFIKWFVHCLEDMWI